MVLSVAQGSWSCPSWTDNSMRWCHTGQYARRYVESPHPDRQLDRFSLVRLSSMRQISLRSIPDADTCRQETPQNWPRTQSMSDYDTFTTAEKPETQIKNALVTGRRDVRPQRQTQSIPSHHLGAVAHALDLSRIHGALSLTWRRHSLDVVSRHFKQNVSQNISLQLRGSPLSAYRPKYRPGLMHEQAIRDGRQGTPSSKKLPRTRQPPPVSSI